MAKKVVYKKVLPKKSIEDFVAYFWHLENISGHEIITDILPDGFFDILVTSNSGKDYRIFLTGFQTKPVSYVVPANCQTFAVSLKIPAVQLFQEFSINSLTNNFLHLPADFFNFNNADFLDLNTFIERTSEIISNKISAQKDFPLLKISREIYQSKGERKVEDFAKSFHLSQRTLHRIFTAQVGLTLKSYCKIMRFRETFGDLNTGKTYPDAEYSDQSHFIKDTKSFAGALPKELSENKNDRFLQLSTLSSI